MLSSLEVWLAGVYKGAPPLSSGARKSIANIWPWVALIFGALQLLGAVSLWHVGHQADQAINTLNSLYATSGVTVHSLNAFYWISLIVLVVDGLILLAAFPKLRVRSKAGWNLLFYGALLNLVYGVFSAFNNYDGFGQLVMQVIVTAVVLYFLFQIRDQYTAKA